ncbi:hypothetical protein E2C01_003914 [Portunus trituberculatus]|uniref:Uncharacterized protein n=1 Tax=Portunus trituberculatus TaxID=210409 RepID=A0A5B7CUY5_PORTR|nr:hypothetical protein [Portunus trituberculatus]
MPVLTCSTLDSFSSPVITSTSSNFRFWLFSFSVSSREDSANDCPPPHAWCSSPGCKHTSTHRADSCIKYHHHLLLLVGWSQSKTNLGIHTLEISEAASEKRLPVCGWPLVVAPAAAAAAVRLAPAAAPPPLAAPSDHCHHNICKHFVLLLNTASEKRLPVGFSPLVVGAAASVARPQPPPPALLLPLLFVAAPLWEAIVQQINTSSSASHLSLLLVVRDSGRKRLLAPMAEVLPGFGEPSTEGFSLNSDLAAWGGDEPVTVRVGGGKKEVPAAGRTGPPSLPDAPREEGLSTPLEASADSLTMMMMKQD